MRGEFILFLFVFVLVLDRRETKVNRMSLDVTSSISEIPLASEIEAARVQDFTSAQNHLEHCYAKQQAADEEYDIFLNAHTRTEIQADPILTAKREFLKSASRLAWLARLRALPLARKPSLEDALWVIARAGYTSEIKPCMNLCRSTRDCKHLQVLMKNAKNEDGLTQLAYFCIKRSH